MICGGKNAGIYGVVPCTVSLPVYKMSETDDERQFSDSSEGNPVRNGLLHSGAKKEGSLTSVCQACVAWMFLFAVVGAFVLLILMKVRV